MAALSSTSPFTSFPYNRTPLHTNTLSSNSKTHLAFPPSSNSKRLKFSLKAEKKDSPANNFSEESQVKNEPNRKKSKDRKRLNIGSKIHDEEEAQILRKEMDKKIEELRLQKKKGVYKENEKKFTELLEKLETLREASNPLDLNKLSDCFDDNTFLVTKVERYQSGGMFYGNLRVPVDQALPVLEKRLSEAAGKEMDIYFSKVDEELELVTVLPKSQTDLVYFLDKRKYGDVIAATLSVTTLGTIALMSGFFLKPDATFDYYLDDVLPLFGGFLTILGVSEVATRVTAAGYGVKLSTSVLVPSIWTGCLGILNDYESRLPNKKALFDIPLARTTSSYMTSLSLIVAAYLSDGSLNGGDNPLYIRPDFFFNNPLLSLIQFINGDDLNNRLPYEVDAVGLTVNPLAFAGLLGMIVTSINLLPCGGLEGRRIFEAIFGRYKSRLVSAATLFILLVIGVLSGSVLFVAWALLNAVFPSRSGVVAKDGITPLGEGRYALGVLLALICFLTLFPNAGGTFSSWSLTEPYFRGFV